MRRRGLPSRRALYFPGGVLPSPAAPPASQETTPLTILEAIRAGSAIQWQRPNLGVTLNGSNVAAWSDQSAAANHDAQGTALAQPLFIATDAAANNKPGIQFDGTATYLENAIARPAPTTASTLIWCVLRQDAWVSGDSLFAGIDATRNLMCAAQQSASPGLRQLNTVGVNENSGAAIGAVKRVAFYFSGSTNDFTNAGATLVTGASSGDITGSTGHRKGTNRSATVFSAWTVFDWVMANGLTPAEASTAVTNLDAYATPLFGVGIVT